MPGVDVGRFTFGPTDKLAAALVLVALAVYAFSRASNALGDWTPHIVVGLLTIAATVSIVDKIIQREGRRRAGVRVERILYWMGLAFRGLVSAIVIDYACSHYKTFKPIPRDALEMIDFWIAEQMNEDLPRPLDAEDRYPMLILEAQDFGRSLAQARELNLDVLDPELVRVIDDFHWLVGQAMQMYDFAAHGLGDAAKNREVGLHSAVEATQQFAKVFRRYGPEWMPIQELTADAAAVHSRMVGERAASEAAE